MKKIKRGNRGKNNKSLILFNIVSVCLIVLLVAGLFLLEKYKKSGYAYEGEYVYAKDDERKMINIEFEPERDVLLINLTEINKIPCFEYEGKEHYYDLIMQTDHELPMSDMSAVLKPINDTFNSMYMLELTLEFDKKGVTLFRDTIPEASLISSNQYYFYKNGWLYSTTAEIVQLVIIAVLMVHIMVCAIINIRKYKKYISQVDESFYDKFTIGEMIYINDSFKGMEDYFENNIMDSPVEFSVYNSKIREKEIERPEYKVSMVNEPYFTRGKNTTVKQIEIFDNEGKKSEYVVLHRKGRYILKQGDENMTIAVYKLIKVMSVVLILGLVGITLGGCRQEVSDKYKVTGRIVSIENNVIRLNMAMPDLYSPTEHDEKTLRYIFDKDDYFVDNKVYEDLYYMEQDSMYVDFELSDDWHKYFNEEEILKKSSSYLYELVIEDGKVESCMKTDYYCLSTDNVPPGMIGEFYCGIDTLITDYMSGDDVELIPEEYVRWDFYGGGIVFNKSVLQGSSSEKICYFKIQNINKLRVYRLEDAADNVEQYWIDTISEDLIIKLKDDHYDVFSYPGGVFLDEDGNLGYYNSDITKSSYTVTDLGYEVKEQTITIINKGGE